MQYATDRNPRTVSTETATGLANQVSVFWKGRPKRMSRRVAHDLRASMPGLWILFCLFSTASVIAAAEAVPTQTKDSAPTRKERTAISPADLSEAGETDRRPTQKDCARPDLFLAEDLD